MSLYRTQSLKTFITHPRSIASFADSLFAYFGDTVSNSAWKPLQNICRAQVINVLKNIDIGSIVLTTTTSEALEFGNLTEGHGDLRAKLTIKDDSFWVRVALFTDLGLAESFMVGEVESDDIYPLFKVCLHHDPDLAFVDLQIEQILIHNRKHLTALETWTAAVLSQARKLTSIKFLGDLMNSKANISAHYDIGVVMFKAFTDERMVYSTAIWKDFERNTLDESLEDAQLRKLKMLINKLKLQSGHRILEIGTGWGAFPILAAKCFDCTIDTVTLSATQAEYARKLIADENLSDRITVHHMDYRDCLLKPEWKGQFDRFLSVEMMEHVGKDYLSEYWSMVDWVLKPQDGVGVVQVMTIPEARIPAYDQSGVDFVQKWGTGGKLLVDSIFNIAPHYPGTLLEWKRRFLENWEDQIAPELTTQFGLDYDGLEIFKRRWTYYFDYCAAGFATRTLGDHVITFTREGNTAFGCDYTVDEN
ncbi:hypothetical protein D9758_008938 [Tetrapyrgos nigripes]|uniref:Cyclopropane-fatty-acyl-phospholipid synthase n=1 Tax=Tetrapyrgos nigripes TaxID=182062 RepID=A0A8H5GK79_9AGAR|nr:hypothetical protein D9758_008938 [Tetrapyrgos nigripes]